MICRLFQRYLKITILQSCKFSTQGKQPNLYVQKHIETLQTIPSFIIATKYAAEEKFELAEKCFQETYGIIQKNYEDDIDLQIAILKRIALIQKILGKNSQLKQLLEELFFMNFSIYSLRSPDTIKIMKNLLIHYCIYDINRVDYKIIAKGVAFIDNLKEMAKKDISHISIKRELLYFEGILQGLKGENMGQADVMLTEALTMGFTPIQKGILLNNQAIISWWNSLQIIQNFQNQLKIMEQQDTNNPENESKIIENQKKILDFTKNMHDKSKTILLSLKKAISAFEFEDKERQKDKLTEKQYFDLKKLLNESIVEAPYQNFKMEDIILKNQMSSVCAMNIGEFFYHIGSFEHAQFWLQLSISSACANSDIGRVLRSLVLQSLIAQKLNKNEFAEKVLIDCLVQSSGFLTYNKIFCLETYANYLRKYERNYEADGYQEQANNLLNKFQYFDERKENILIPDYDLNF